MDCEDNPEKNEMREKIEKMSFEQIQKLQEKLGLKVYNEAVFGLKHVGRTDFKRANKNRPRELSSKRPEPLRSLKKSVKNEVRDPRFDSLCGEFSDDKFRRNYKFIGEIRKKEKEQLIRQLRMEEDGLTRRRIKAELQRLKNKEREELNKERKKEKEMSEREEKIRMLQEGKKPHFKTKLESRVSGLVEKYSELKKQGKLQKHIEKQRKKLSQKEKKKGLLK